MSCGGCLPSGRVQGELCHPGINAGSVCPVTSPGTKTKASSGFETGGCNCPKLGTKEAHEVYPLVTMMRWAGNENARKSAPTCYTMRSASLVGPVRSREPLVLSASTISGTGLVSPESGEPDRLGASAPTLDTLRFRRFADTADTAAKIQAYQRKPAPLLACTPDTADTAEKIITGANAANDFLWQRFDHTNRADTGIAWTVLAPVGRAGGLRQRGAETVVWEPKTKPFGEKLSPDCHRGCFATTFEPPIFPVFVAAFLLQINTL